MTTAANDNMPFIPLVCQHSVAALEVLKTDAESILDGDKIIEYLLKKEKESIVKILLNLMLKDNHFGKVIDCHLEELGLPRDNNTETIAVPADFTAEDIKLYSLDSRYLKGKELSENLSFVSISLWD